MHPHTKLGMVINKTREFDADLIAVGHTHGLSYHTQEGYGVDLRNKMVVKNRKHFVLTGHYLEYSQSYAQVKGYPPAKVGSPKVKLFADRHDIHISI